MKSIKHSHFLLLSWSANTRSGKVAKEGRGRVWPSLTCAFSLHSYLSSIFPPSAGKNSHDFLSRLLFPVIGKYSCYLRLFVFSSFFRCLLPAFPLSRCKCASPLPLFPSIAFVLVVISYLSFHHSCLFVSSSVESC